MAVERFERCLQFGGNKQRIEHAAFAAPFLWHLGRDVRPQFAKHRHFGFGNVVRNRNARELHNAALDRIHEREITHRPWKQRAFDVARATQKERCRREVEYARNLNA